VVIDPGGEVDTMAFNRINHREALNRLAAEHQQAFDLLRHGLKRGDWGAVGEAATLSARVHQTILPNPLFGLVIALAREVGALGVCRAHSGTLLGLLVHSHRIDLSRAESYLASRLPDSVKIASYSLVDGGPRYTASVNQLAQNSKAELRPAVIR
jgi:L-threonine kinase